MMLIQPKYTIISVLVVFALIQAIPIDSIRDWHILLNESFNLDTLPPGWTINDENNNGTSWYINTLANRAEYTDSGYAYGEALISPALAIPIGAESLKIEYDYLFDFAFPQEYYKMRMRKNDGSGWSLWTDLRNYMTDTSGRDHVVLSSFLPTDSMQFDWSYWNMNGCIFTICMVDSIMFKCFDANCLNEKSEERSKQPTFFIFPSIIKTGSIISFTVSQSTTGSLDLYDATGRKATRIYQGKFSLGNHTYKIRKDLPSGVYFIILDTPNIKMHQKLLIK
jgi:hypothetical protein